MSLETVLILAGAMAGGFVNGLTGFGTGMTALVLWLHVMPPLVAAPLVVVASIVAQLQTLPAIWHAIDVRRLLPFVIGGLAGIPLGTWILVSVRVAPLKFWLGVLIATYCTIMLAGGLRPVVQKGGRAADALVGFLGGILGGIAGLSGPLPTIWASLRGWGKDERRAVFQGFNLTVLVVSLAAHGAAGLLTAELARVVVIALPGTLAGAFLGQRVYRRLDGQRYDRLVLAILLVAGCTLMWSSR